MKKTGFLTAKLVFVLMTIFCASLAISGQEITGTIVGTVRDANGAAVVGATVSINDSTKGNITVRTVVTNSTGEFNAPNLPVSTYQIVVEAANFKKIVKNDVKLNLGERREVPITLEAGNITTVCAT